MFVVNGLHGVRQRLQPDRRQMRRGNRREMSARFVNIAGRLLLCSKLTEDGDEKLFDFRFVPELWIVFRGLRRGRQVVQTGEFVRWRTNVRQN